MYATQVKLESSIPTVPVNPRGVTPNGCGLRYPHMRCPTIPRFISLVVGVLWRRHTKTLTATFLTRNRGKQSQPLFQWFAGRTKQHIRCLVASLHVELLF
jgi:hypothetical protein